MRKASSQIEKVAMSDQEMRMTEGLAGSEHAEDEPGGLRWLKYAGIGPRRTHDGARRKLSAEAITSLGSLEAEVMGILWEINRPATSMDVSEGMLYKRRAAGQEPASFATINTTLRRLADKGLLKGHKNANRTPLYTPTVPREEMAARILNNVSETLLGHSLHGLLPKLLGNIRPTAKGKPGSATEDEAVERLLKALELAAVERNQQPE